MNILVIGATGFVGGGVARHLCSRGHRVTGLARTPAAAERLTGSGVIPMAGNLDQGLEAAAAAAASSDAVIFAAQLAPDHEHTVVTALLDALSGTATTFVFTSGSGVLLQRTAGSWSPDCYGEDDTFAAEPLAATRLRVEQLVRGAAGRGTRSMVVRPGLIWGPGDHGHVPMVYQSVAVTGAACYIGDGLSTYTNVHIDDAARLFGLALDHGSSGALYHAAGGEIPNRWIAEAVAADLGCATRSLTTAEATKVWGEFGALIMAASSRITDRKTRDQLNWSPRQGDMLTEIGQARLRELADAHN